MKKQRRKRKASALVSQGGNQVKCDRSSTEQKTYKLDFSASVQAQMMAAALKTDERRAECDSEHAALRESETEEERKSRLQVLIKNQWIEENRDMIVRWMRQEGRLPAGEGGDAQQASAEAEEEELSDCSEISDASLGTGFHFKDPALEDQLQMKTSNATSQSSTDKMSQKRRKCGRSALESKESTTERHAETNNAMAKKMKRKSKQRKGKRNVSA
mmetsp:Transcript_43092/g.77389  ORF Transcript_43092/g.77389 Transcript_43092/m.77389 type:complete len:216 (-) Transcript_43092:11-658(-)